jgi:hypothetical protein
MLHLGPGASRKRVPPSPDVPSGNTLGSITRRSHKSPTACSPRASTIPGSLSLASSGHFHAPRPGGRRFPPTHGSAPLHRRPPRRHPHRKDAPRPGLRHRLRSSARASGPPRTAVATLWELRFGCVVRVVGIGGSRGHLRALRRQVLSSSFPALPRSFLTCAAWSFLRDHLTPRPAVAKSTYRFCVRKIRCSPALQNIGNGAGESPQSSGAGRSRLGKHGASRHLLAASGVASKRREHQPQPSPALGRSGAGCRKIAHPAPHGPTLDQKSQAAKRKKRRLLDLSLCNECFNNLNDLLLLAAREF